MLYLQDILWWKHGLRVMVGTQSIVHSFLISGLINSFGYGMLVAHKGIYRITNSSTKLSILDKYRNLTYTSRYSNTEIFFPLQRLKCKKCTKLWYRIVNIKQNRNVILCRQFYILGQKDNFNCWDLNPRAKV